MVEETSAGQSRTSGVAVASLVLSLLSVVIGPFGCIPGIICGHVARRQSARDPRSGGRGVALAGLIIGYVFFAVLVLMALFYLTITPCSLRTDTIDGVAITIKPGGYATITTEAEGVTTVTAGETKVRLDHLNLSVNGTEYGRVSKGDKVPTDHGVVSVDGEKRVPLVLGRQAP